jgi:hypothetical protein
VVGQLCNKALLLSKGQLLMNDRTSVVVNQYINQANDEGTTIRKALKAGENQFSEAFMTDAQGNRRSEYGFDEEIVAEVEVHLDDFSHDLELALRLMDRFKNPVFTILEKLDGHYQKSGNVIRLHAKIPPVFITPGTYSWQICINQPGVAVYDLQNDVLGFYVRDTGSEFARYDGQSYGSVFAKYSITNITGQPLMGAKVAGANIPH